MENTDIPILGTSANDHQQFNLNKALFRDYLTWTGSAAAPGAQFRDMIGNKRARFSLDLGIAATNGPGSFKSVYPPSPYTLRLEARIT